MNLHGGEKLQIAETLTKTSKEQPPILPTQTQRRNLETHKFATCGEGEGDLGTARTHKLATGGKGVGDPGTARTQKLATCGEGADNPGTARTSVLRDYSEAGKPPSEVAARGR